MIDPSFSEALPKLLLDLDQLKLVERLAADHEQLLPGLKELWDEQEYGSAREARFLKVVDRLLPFLHNITSEGKTWRKLGIKKSQVLAKHAFIAVEFPELHQWMMTLLDDAADKGWVTDA